MGENRRLKASLAESRREKEEMSKVLAILENRLSQSNEYLRDAFCSEQAKQPKFELSCGKALMSTKQLKPSSAAEADPSQVVEAQQSRRLVQPSNPSQATQVRDKVWKGGAVHGSTAMAAA